MITMELTFYGVTAAGVIVAPDIPDPQIRREVFELVDTRGVHSCDDLIELIDSCEPLQMRFQELAQAWLDEHACDAVDCQMDDEVQHTSRHTSHITANHRRPAQSASHAKQTPISRRIPDSVAGSTLQTHLRIGIRIAQTKILQTMRRDPHGGWRQWIEFSADAHLQSFLDHVQDWLDEDIEWSECEHFDSLWNGQLAAFEYFEDLPSAILKAVGVQIVDGDAPGSNYRAAELHMSIEQANHIAQWLKQDFRFEPCDALSIGDAHG